MSSDFTCSSLLRLYSLFVLFTGMKILTFENFSESSRICLIFTTCSFRLRLGDTLMLLTEFALISTKSWQSYTICSSLRRTPWKTFLLCSSEKESAYTPLASICGWSVWGLGSFPGPFSLLQKPSRLLSPFRLHPIASRPRLTWFLHYGAGIFIAVVRTWWRSRCWSTVQVWTWCWSGWGSCTTD